LKIFFNNFLDVLTIILLIQFKIDKEKKYLVTEILFLFFVILYFCVEMNGQELLVASQLKRNAISPTNPLLLFSRI